MPHRRLSLALCLSFIALFGRPEAGARDSEYGRTSLRGLPSFRVVVEQLGPTIEAAGLTKQQLQSDVQLRLQEAGVPISNDAPALLYAAVSIVCNQLACGYNIELEVQQKVRLVLHPEAGTLFATTWTTGTTGLMDHRLQSVRDRVRGQVDRFLDAYRAVNAK